MRKYKSNIQGECPVCKSKKLNWGHSEDTGDCIGYFWKCEDCDSQGIEWYHLVFEGHDVINYKNKNIDTNFEMVNDYILPDCEAHDE